jgi:hypothetical protein
MPDNKSLQLIRERLESSFPELCDPKLSSDGLRKVLAHALAELNGTTFPEPVLQRALIEVQDQLLHERIQQAFKANMWLKTDIMLTNIMRLAVSLLMPPSSATAKRCAPPTAACFLLDLFLAKTDREVIPADLEEEFTTSILPKYGVRRARFWFWTQTARTIATRNPVCRWLLVGGLVRIGEWVLRKIGS